MIFLIIYIMLNGSFQKEARPTGVSRAGKNAHAALAWELRDTPIVMGLA